MTFCCKIEADLCKEEILYAGSSPGKALETVSLAIRVVTLFNLTAHIKVTRYIQVGGREPVLDRWIYKEGELVKEELLVSIDKWQDKELPK